MKFAFEGTVSKGMEKRKFQMEIDAKSKNDAVQTLYAKLGAELGACRNQVNVSGCEEIK